MNNIIPSGINGHRNVYVLFQVNIIWVYEVAIQLSTCHLFLPVDLRIAKFNQSYILVAWLSFKFGCISFIWTWTTSLRSISYNLVFFILIPISSVIIKWNGVLLVSVVSLRLLLLNVLCVKLGAICRLSLKFSRINYIMTGAVFLILGWNLVRDIAFLILSLIIEFVSIWLIGVFRFIVRRFGVDRFIVSSICRF